MQQRKYYPCRRNCGTQVTFDNAHKSQSGKYIPLEKDSIGQLQPHQCPNRGEQQQHQEVGSTTTTTTTGDRTAIELSKEIAAVKAQLLVLVGRLDRLEQELQK
jgi:hypothetical protein